MSEKTRNFLAKHWSEVPKPEDCYRVSTFWNRNYGFGVEYLTSFIGLLHFGTIIIMALGYNTSCFGSLELSVKFANPNLALGTLLCEGKSRGGAEMAGFHAGDRRSKAIFKQSHIHHRTRRTPSLFQQICTQRASERASS